MKAMVIDGFGGPEVLRLAEVDYPLMGPDQVLIRTRVAGVNPVDFKTIAGRQAQRYPHHFPLIPGWDVGGTVEATGNAVTRFQPGDDVVAFARKSCVQHGTYAQYVSVAEESVALAPKSVDMVAAAGLPLASLTALQVIQAAEIDGEQVVLVHGGSGGVGSFAVQLLRDRGATVLATSGAASHDYLSGLGARPLDRHGDVPAAVRELFPDGVDAALDLAGGQDLVQLSLPLLKDGGRVASILAAPDIPSEHASRGVQGRYVFVRPYGDQLAGLVDMVDAGRLSVNVHRAFDLPEAADALRLLQGGGIRGKLVLRV